MTISPNFHGSDLEAAAAFYHVRPEDVVRFGANVNPLGFPRKVAEELTRHMDLLGVYPDRNYTSLCRAIGEYCHVDPQTVLTGNGSTELISLLIQCRRPLRTLVVGPTYSEYSRELSLCGSRVSNYFLKEEQDFVLQTDAFCRTLSEGYDLVILCNPNNPTSSAVPAESLRMILDTLKRQNGFLMIDETYIEFAPDMEQLTAMPLTRIYDNLIVLRGVSKFFAAPGLRLGYAVTGSPSLMKELRELQNPWSLNTLGAFAGELLLKDSDYIEQSRKLIDGERTRMYRALSELPGFRPFAPSANFLLVKLEKPGLTSAKVFETLFRQNMMIRDCSSFQTLEGQYIRFCFMMPEDNTRLLRSLASI